MGEDQSDSSNPDQLFAEFAAFGKLEYHMASGSFEFNPSCKKAKERGNKIDFIKFDFILRALYWRGCSDDQLCVDRRGKKLNNTLTFNPAFLPSICSSHYPS